MRLAVARCVRNAYVSPPRVFDMLAVLRTQIAVDQFEGSPDFCLLGRATVPRDYGGVVLRLMKTPMGNPIANDQPNLWYRGGQNLGLQRLICAKSRPLRNNGCGGRPFGTVSFERLNLAVRQR